MTPLATTAGIIATKNQSAFILAAVESLATQVDEVIVVDDGSSDNTLAILLECRFSNLRVHANETSEGVSRAFNRAVSLSNADVILIQGGDDVSLPWRASTSLETLNATDAILAFSQPAVIGESGRSLVPETAGEFFVDLPADVLSHLYFVGNFLCAPSVAMRRIDYEQAGGFSPASQFLQDFSLWLTLAARGEFVVMQDPVVSYRKHGHNLSRESSASRQSPSRRFTAEMDYILWKFLEDADHRTLMRLADFSGFDLSIFGRANPTEQRMLLHLSHPMKTQIRRGLANLFDIFSCSGGIARCESLGIDFSDLDRFSALADHDNADERAEIIAAYRSLGTGGN